MSDVVRKVGAGYSSSTSKIEWLKEHIHHVPPHRKLRVARLIVAFEKGQEFDTRELNYALDTVGIVEKRLDSPFYS